MHEEWFPLNYPDSFYEKISNSHDLISLGCYIDLKGRKGKKHRALLGIILTRIQRGKEDINEIYYAKDVSSQGLLGFLGHTFLCRERVGAYIATIGIIDECRRLGLGSMLLSKVTEILREQYTNCEVLYLHVVDYNETAIRFYEKNDFRTLKRMKNHYLILGKEYDALVLYKDIKRS